MIRSLVFRLRMKVAIALYGLFFSVFPAENCKRRLLSVMVDFWVDELEKEDD